MTEAAVYCGGGGGGEGAGLLGGFELPNPELPPKPLFVFCVPGDCEKPLRDEFCIPLSPPPKLPKPEDPLAPELKPEPKDWPPLVPELKLEPRG